MLARLTKKMREWVKVTPEEVHEQYVKDNEEVKIKYVLMESKDFVEAKKVEEYYGKNKEEYRVPEQVRARHILVKLEKEAGAETEKKARGKAEEVLKALEKGGDFAELAKKYSQGPTAEKGGDLGFFPYQGMDPEFAKAAFALKKGETSGLVRSRFGYHIIKLEERKDSSIRPLEEAAGMIRRNLSGEEEKSKAREKLQTIWQEIKTSPAMAAAQDFKESGFFKRGGFIPQFGWAPDVVKTAFSLEEGELSEVIESSGGFALIQLLEKKKAEEEKFEEDKAKAAEKLLREKTGRLYSDWLQATKERAEIKRF